MSTDELTGVQALEPTQLDLPTAPGLVGHAAFNAAFPGAESRAAGRQSIPGLFAA